MEVYSSYITSLKKQLSIYNNFDELDNPLCKYNTFHMELNYIKNNDKTKVFDIVVNNTTNIPIVDQFNVKFNYVENNKSCDIKFIDVVKDDFPDLYTLFSSKSMEFTKKHKDIFKRYKIAQDSWMLYGGSSELLITGNYIIDENENYLSSEFGEFITF